MKKISILITCFNRVDYTVKCITSLSKYNDLVDIYLVDDGSTDGTSQIISEQFNYVNIIQGDGSLFWNRGMHLAWLHASNNIYDYYIWLNNDVELFVGWLEELLNCSKIKNDNSIISGLICSKDKSKCLYGGRNEQKSIIIPDGNLSSIYYLNGNVVLIPKSVFNVLGNLDPIYVHDLGDVDYGLRAIKNNIYVYSTTKFIGSGLENFINRERKLGVGVIKRFKILYSPLGSNPFINFYFRKKHFNYYNAFLYFFFQHFLNILPDRLVSFFFKKYYR